MRLKNVKKKVFLRLSGICKKIWTLKVNFDSMIFYNEIQMVMMISSRNHLSLEE